MTDEFLILASDGLWKAVENQAAVDLVREVKDPKVAAKQLVDYAIQLNSKDDISCVGGSIPLISWSTEF
ncbi:hypothetical protein GOP47_0014625 [Adiantum capillus-veneris]|uniref:PPM-type phosphatase domain-containing protein n=1 Tax=Adiantum capillus-veneris TaxID=13818 RepID=A0A9D4ZDN9_ADICA|nr:hypothetical protein GOP47_0014625 [Adiantum capillus-veneris]